MLVFEIKFEIIFYTAHLFIHKMIEFGIMYITCKIFHQKLGLTFVYNLGLCKILSQTSYVPPSISRIGLDGDDLLGSILSPICIL